MSKILYLDTTASRLMIAVSVDGAMRAQYAEQTDSHRYHSALMIPAIQQVLSDAGVEVRELTALAVNHGPGSFTGIRTGISTIRTMSQFLNLPVHVFNTFELLAAGRLEALEEGQEPIVSESGAVDESPEPVAVYLDALRGRVYHAVVAFDEAGPVYPEPPALQTLAPEAMPSVSAPRMIVAPTLAPLFTQSALPPETVLQLIPVNPDTPAAMLALINRYGQRFCRTWQEVKPLYLQEPSITLKKTSPAQ